MEYEEIVGGFGERYGRLYLFEPLHKLERMKKKDRNDRPIDMRGLGLLALLYFFEQKIIRQTKVGKSQLAQFLYEVTHHQISCSQEEYKVIARTIIDAFRPGGGEKDTYSFYNWETNAIESVSYQYLKASSFDPSTQEQYYILDEHGLELVFATKEFYSEFQLSISQLVLRKQLEKGEFKGALRQINEMRVAVESIESQLERLQQEIKRNIVSADIFSRYQKTLEDTHYRLKYENEEFQELQQFVTEAKERLYYQDTSKKEIETYNIVLTISNELEAVHAYHTKLLEKSIRLQSVALEAAKEALYYIGVESFNFDQDVTARIITTPLPMESMKAILAPFLRVEQQEQWSLLTILGKQNVYEERPEDDKRVLLQIDEEAEMLAEQNLTRYYTVFLQILLEALQQQPTITLKQLIGQIETKEEQAQLLHTRYFYDFFILLHQRSPIEQVEEVNQEGYLWGELHKLLGKQRLDVKELPEILQATERFSIQNMSITLGGESIELS